MLGNLRILLFLLIGSKRIDSDERIIGGSVAWGGGIKSNNFKGSALHSIKYLAFCKV